MPLYRRLPKEDLTSIRKKRIAINLHNISKLIESKNRYFKINWFKNIFTKTKVSKKVKVKVLGTGDIKVKVNIMADKFSKLHKQK